MIQVLETGEMIQVLVTGEIVQACADGMLGGGSRVLEEAEAGCMRTGNW